MKVGGGEEEKSDGLFLLVLLRATTVQGDGREWNVEGNVMAF